MSVIIFGPVKMSALVSKQIRLQQKFRPLALKFAGGLFVCVDALQSSQFFLKSCWDNTKAADKVSSSRT